MQIKKPSVLNNQRLRSLKTEYANFQAKAVYQIKTVLSKVLYLKMYLLHATFK